jgi:hypothetical protein
VCNDVRECNESNDSERMRACDFVLTTRALAAAVTSLAVLASASAPATPTMAAGRGPGVPRGTRADLNGAGGSTDCAANLVPACRATNGDEILSDETTFTTWAGAARASPVWPHPSRHEAPAGYLHHLTADAFPEVYPMLRLRQIGLTSWVEIRLPTRTPNQTGWVPRTALEPSHLVTTELVVSRARHRLWLNRGGRTVFQSAVGIGRAATPTPAGHFWVREAFPVPPSAPAYGPFAIGTSAYSVLVHWPGGGVIGIHGTNDPSLIPGPASYGCVVLRNGPMEALASRVPIGTPLLIE